MTSLLLIDWLGRGGIAQTSQAWQTELLGAGASVTVVTRLGRELADTWQSSVPAHPGRNRFLEHQALITRAVAAIEELQPEIVVIQNHVVPLLEGAVDRAARRRSAQVVRIVHDHMLHSRTAGTQLGLRRLLRRADLLVAHSHFVGDRVRRSTGRQVSVIPLPQLITAPSPATPCPVDARDPFAVQFGVLNRSYKDQAALADVARLRPQWALVSAGVGAVPLPGGAAIDRFLDASELAALVSKAAAALFPYRFATQSGGVAVAQALGTVPIATAVGGIVEQIDDGRTGILLGPHSAPQQWAEALDQLSDDQQRSSMEQRCISAGAARGKAFRSFVGSLVGDQSV